MSVTALTKILVGPFTDLISKFIPDKDKAAQLAHDLATLADNHQHEINLAQIGVNKAEAESASLFKGGWRPAAGWVCVLAMFNNYILAPYVEAFMSTAVPVLGFNELLPVLLGMLGLSWNRTDEKKSGVASK